MDLYACEGHSEWGWAQCKGLTGGLESLVCAFISNVSICSAQWKKITGVTTCIMSMASEVPLLFLFLVCFFSFWKKLNSCFIQNENGHERR